MWVRPPGSHRSSPACRARAGGAHGRASRGVTGRRWATAGWAVTSLAPNDPGFQPTRYWRGPVWPILNWVLQRGLERYGYSDEAEQLRQGVIELGRRAGFWEHYNPLTGRGHGGEQFAWTAALVLDLLQDGATAGGASGH